MENDETQMVYVETTGATFYAPMPAACPICNNYALLTVTTSKAIYTETKTIDKRKTHAWTSSEVVAHCQRPACGRLFIAVFDIDRSTLKATLKKVFPKQTKLTVFSDAISQLSPDFVRIYNQAENALASDLTDIAGPGFRKAAEFLVKDYAAQKEPTKAESIKTQNAATVVKEYFDDRRVKSVAERAFWLGNDETHYVRKWENKNIADLINLVTLTVHYIDMDELASGYMGEMKR